MKCGKDYAAGVTMVECPICEGAETECRHCVDGWIQINQCPRQYIGGDLVEAINMAAMCGKGDWPVAGGLLDQSSWLIDLKQTLSSDQHQIEQDQWDKQNGS